MNKKLNEISTDDLLMEVSRRYCLAQGIEYEYEDPILTAEQSEWFDAFNELMAEAGK